uniref:Transcription termination factor MTEF18, mitochondrial n=2 Tax=Noccaea caerulescens TaxID=107243 RepID=A0A1J3JI01_NOCCA
MSLMRNPRFITLLKWVSQVSVETQSGTGYHLRLTLKSRSFATVVSSGEKLSVGTRIENQRMAQVAMLDYFYITRGLQFLVAESMSKNAPLFNNNLVEKLNCDADADIARSITRFLRYHPINEFEPFFESLGMKPSEYSHLLPRDKMFLNEDAFLLENYNTFWVYGIGLKQIGKIFKEAREVLRYETGVLASKIQAFENLGLTKTFVSKIIVCRPSILIGNMNVEVAKVLEMLKSIGIGVDWVNENLSEEEESYDWSSMHRALSLLRDLCFDENELCELIKKHPRLVFEDSGVWTLSLAGFQAKLGSSRSELCLFFQEFPEIQVKKCVLNLRHCFLFLNQIKMEYDEIGKIFRSHSHWLGACPLKQTKTLLSKLSVGTSRLCQIIRENPEEMRKWTMGLRVQPLPSTGELETSRLMKKQFLLNLGYEENSKEMERAVKKFHGRGSELQQRFDFLVSLGLNEKDVRNMVNAFPQILSQSSDLIVTKVNYVVKELGYPLSTFVAFPSCLVFTLQRMKLRLGMIPYLKGKVKAISSVLVCSDQHFVTHYVNRHPDGPKHWEDLKKQLLCE